MTDGPATITPFELGAMPVFEGLGSDELDALVDAARVSIHKPGEQVFAPHPEPVREVFVIASGIVQLQAAGPEGPVVLAHLRDPSVLCESSLLEAGPRNLSAQAVSGVKLVALDELGLEQLIDTCPRAALGIVRNVGAMSTRCLRKVKDVCLVLPPEQLERFRSEVSYEWQFE